MKRLFLLALLSAIPFAASTDALGISTAQEEVQEHATYELLSSQDIVVRRYLPQTVSFRDLYENVRDLRGRKIYIIENGGLSGKPISNLSTMDNAILVRDKASAVEAIMGLMKDLERTLGGEKEEASLHLLEFSPRFISLESAHLALGPFERFVADPQVGRGKREIPNLTIVGERNVIIMRDSPAQVTEMLELLTRLDVPEKQMRIRVWVAIGDPENLEVKGLPADLAGDLSSLLPGFGFRSDGFSIVQASVATNRSVELEIEGLEQDYSLLMIPTAYDPQGGRLTLGKFQFVRRARPVRSEQGVTSVQTQQTSRVLFSTSAVLNAGDYTVLGASGRSPIFLVVKVEPLIDKSRASTR